MGPTQALPGSVFRCSVTGGVGVSYTVAGSSAEAQRCFSNDFRFTASLVFAVRVLASHFFPSQIVILVHYWSLGLQTLGMFITRQLWWADTSWFSLTLPLLSQFCHGLAVMLLVNLGSLNSGPWWLHLTWLSLEAVGLHRARPAPGPTARAQTSPWPVMCAALLFLASSVDL